MGGLGSGRWYRWDQKDLVNQYRPLDVRKLQRDGSLTPGHGTMVSWSNGRAEACGTIRIFPHADSITLDYRVQSAGREWEDLQYDILLTRTDCHLGGSRPWFICPGVVNGRACGRRVAVLYGAHYFLCRNCHRLGYETQREDAAGRARIKAQNIRRRLGGSTSLLDPIPKRPTGMHFRTYWRLLNEAQDAEQASWLGIIAWMGRQDTMLKRRLPELDLG